LLRPRFKVDLLRGGWSDSGTVKLERFEEVSKVVVLWFRELFTVLEVAVVDSANREKFKKRLVEDNAVGLTGWSTEGRE